MKRSELARRLALCGAESPEAEARMCFDALSRTPSATPDPESDALGIEESRLLSLLKARKSGTPIQYLLGQAWFYKQCYEVSPDCLIPRPDTEHLVSYAIEHLPKGAVFADLCTGSGCVAISVLCERPDCTALAVDLSAPALAIAERNAKRHGVCDRLTLLQADALTWVPSTPLDAVLSNPPYIESEAIRTLSREVQAEPRMALDGGEDGLAFYRAFCQKSSLYIYRDGFMAFEIGFNQGNALRTLALACGLDATVIKDYSRLDRVCVLRLPPHF